MTKNKVEKILVISFIGLIVAFLVGLGGNIILKAGSPASAPKSEVNFEKRLHSLEDDLEAGNITKHEFDSLSDILRIQIKRSEALTDKSQSTDKIPDWVIKLGIKEPEGMKFDLDFSNSTSVADLSEGFNSVSLVYTGSYEKAVEEAAKIAANAKLSVGGVFKAIGSPVKPSYKNNNSAISYVNYSLEKADQDFLISVQVEPSGLLTIMVTDNKQLNKCLLAYEPLNNRQNSASKRKKQ
ncbi:MAG: hypothetical protein Q7U54_02285 [Bacteroidales bacterium]|nr:hypothetical protein [Bacteroidales bacterium]